jgi:hypothetical protein
VRVQISAFGNAIDSADIQPVLLVDTNGAPSGHTAIEVLEAVFAC